MGRRGEFSSAIKYALLPQPSIECCFLRHVCRPRDSCFVGHGRYCVAFNRQYSSAHPYVLPSCVPGLNGRMRETERWKGRSRSFLFLNRNKRVRV